MQNMVSYISKVPYTVFASCQRTFVNSYIHPVGRRGGDQDFDARARQCGVAVCVDISPPPPVHRSAALAKEDWKDERADEEQLYPQK